MQERAHELLESAYAVAEFCPTPESVPGLDDDTLIDAQKLLAAHRRHVDKYAALIAGEIARRSHRDLGYAGLAQRTGFLSPEAMIQSLTQTSRAEATKLVNVGSLLADAVAPTGSPLDPSDPSLTDDGNGLTGTPGTSPDGSLEPGISVEPGTEAHPALDMSAAGGLTDAPWHSILAAAVTSGLISVDAAHTIRRALADTDDSVTDVSLRETAELLIQETPELTVEQLYRRARRLRDALDAEGVARREKERRDARYLKIWQQPDGMYRLSGLLDPESGLIVAGAIDSILSPRRGGPRFIDPEDRARAERLLADERSNDQIAADALVDMVTLATDADPGGIFGTHRPAVRVIVHAETITTASRPGEAQPDAGTTPGFGHFEGHPDPVSLETVHRYRCNTGTLGIAFDDDGQCVNVGRTKRLFTHRQRIGLALRDGGCRFPDCDRPPSWTEAHHIDEWHRYQGRTDIADGILLCRRHHLLVHNNHWHIIRDTTPGNTATYWLKPPKDIDPHQALRPMPPKGPALEATDRRTTG